MFVSLFAVPELPTHPEKFAILYSIGNIVALGSSCFLWGPWAQVKNMFAPIRAVATIIYLLCIAITIYLAVDVKKTVPILIMIIIQCLAGIWYALSYIPVRSNTMPCSMLDVILTCMLIYAFKYPILSDCSINALSEFLLAVVFTINFTSIHPLLT